MICGEVAGHDRLHVVFADGEMRALYLVAPIIIIIAPFGVASGCHGIMADDPFYLLAVSACVV